MTLWRVTAPYYVAGVITDEDGKVVRCAPILRRMMRRYRCFFPESFKRRTGYKVEKVM